MGYYVFFDESGKIDRQKNTYSYYGALGIKKSEHEQLNNEFLVASRGRELHFQKFSLTNVDMYLAVMSKLLEVANFNIYMVETEKAFGIADKLSIDISKLRELLYIKIPERLIYGILRHLDDFYGINIYIDECKEYDNYDIKSKLEYQLNAQSIYRNKSYMINEVAQMDSKSDICLQGIDVLIGALSFIIDRKYIAYRENLSPEEYEYIKGIVGEEEKALLEDFFEYKSDTRYIVKKNEQEEISEELKNIYEQYNFFNSHKAKNELSDKKFRYVLNAMGTHQSDIDILRENYECVQEITYKLKYKGDIEKLSTLYDIYNKYNYYTQASIQKAEFVYQLINDENKLDKFSKVGLFVWEHDEENVNSRNTEQYINRFLLFKTRFDDYNKIRILRAYKEDTLSSEIECEKILGFGRNSSKIVQRYLKELDINFS